VLDCIIFQLEPSNLKNIKDIGSSMIITRRMRFDPFPFIKLDYPQNLFFLIVQFLDYLF